MSLLNPSSGVIVNVPSIIGFGVLTVSSAVPTPSKFSPVITNVYSCPNIKFNRLAAGIESESSLIFTPVKKSSDYSSSNPIIDQVNSTPCTILLSASIYKSLLMEILLFSNSVMTFSMGMNITSQVLPVIFVPKGHSS